MDSSTPPAPRADAPDWSTQIEEIHCPLCDYNLRGLVEPRCPECGYQFEWIKLLDPTQRKHPYLFEHHPERNVGSFVRTMMGSLRPSRFWTLLRPQQASRPRRLVAYWLVNLLLVLIPSAVMAAPYMMEYYQYTQRNRRNVERGVNGNAARMTEIVRLYGSVGAYVDRMYPHPLSLEALRPVNSRASKHLPLLTAGFVYLAWPWMGVLLLNLYQQSMQRARIFPSHVLRCLVYSADGTILFLTGVVPMMLFFAIYFLHNTRLPQSATMYGWMQNLGMVVIPLVWLLATWRMIVAYRKYLQFPHAAAVVLITEIILFLAILCVLGLFMKPLDFLRMLRIL